jgi:hypothetical protein
VSAYASDNRVRLNEPGTLCLVNLSEVPRVPDDGYVAPLPDGSFEASAGWSDVTRCVFATADEAIRSLIGDPQ